MPRDRASVDHALDDADLPKTGLQTEARGDLENRQKAVADLVAPVRDSLNKVDEKIQQMEVARGDAYGELRAQVQSLITTQKELQSQTGNLVQALRTPNVRGRWGEIQLRRRREGCVLTW